MTTIPIEKPGAADLARQREQLLEVAEDPTMMERFADDPCATYSARLWSEFLHDAIWRTASIARSLKIETEDLEKSRASLSNSSIIHCPWSTTAEICPPILQKLRPPEAF
jgi:hypothetical protein